MRLQRSERWLYFRAQFTMFLEDSLITSSHLMVKHLGIVGAGTMGAGIAQLAARAGIDVALYDVNDTLLRQSIERLKQDFNQAVGRGTATAEQADAVFSRIHPRTHLNDLSHSEIVIEAVIEDLRIKKDLFKHLEAGTKPTTILATNTSTLSVSAIASATHRGDRVVGLHFLFPVDNTDVVEIIRTTQTSGETIQRCAGFLSQLHKVCVTVADVPGFIIHRVRHPFHGEALRILGEHIADVGQIDRIMTAEGGFAVGPFESMDLIGLDAALEMSQSLYASTAGETRFRPHIIHSRMVESGLLGKKSGRGFYVYQDGKKQV
jgi:3-hydroxybutyryl-CoA dehydrogenase